MSATEKLLRFLPLVERLKRIKLQERDRQREEEGLSALMDETGLTLGQMTALEKGLISAEDLGIGKRKFGAGDRGLVDRVRSSPRSSYDSTAFGGKQQPSRLGMNQAAGMQFKPAPQAGESPFGDLPSFADLFQGGASAQTIEKLAQVMQAFGGVPEEQRIPDFEQVAGKYGPLPGEYQYISPDERPKASRIGRKLQEGAKTGTSVDKWEYIRGLTTKDPADLTAKQKRYLIGQGFRYDKMLKAWAKPKAAKGGQYSSDPVENEVLGVIYGGEGGGETPTGGESEAEGKQINYEALAKRLQEKPGIKTKETLEAFKEQLLGQYKGLKWETLKSYFD
jgi:hypothetical protein